MSGIEPVIPPTKEKLFSCLFKEVPSVKEEATTCRCGRLKGLSIETLMKKQSCTDLFVCPRLDKARRTHPKFNEHLNRHGKGTS